MTEGTWKELPGASISKGPTKALNRRVARQNKLSAANAAYIILR